MDTQTTVDGVAVFEGLKNGSYVLVEESAPDGYGGAGFTAIEIAGTAEELHLYGKDVVNTLLRGTITVTKKDGEGRVITDLAAKFKLYDAAAGGNQVGDEQATINGVATFTGLPYGTYYVEETSAPEGFTPAQGRREVRLGYAENPVAGGKVFVTANGAAANVDVTNARRTADITIYKTDGNGPASGRGRPLP